MERGWSCSTSGSPRDASSSPTSPWARAPRRSTLRHWPCSSKAAAFAAFADPPHLMVPPRGSTCRPRGDRMPRMKTDHAGPLIAQLHAWQDEQNPLVRAFSESLVEMVTQALLQMQAVIDQQALVIEQLREENESLRREHAVALQVTKDRIDQLERELYGKKSER